jgi:hypothetical protein
VSLIAALTLAAATAQAQPGFGFDRVDIVSEDPGVWLHYDAPMLGMNAATSAVRLIEQLKPVWTLPVKGLYLGTSISSQSLVYEHALLPKHGLFVTGGLQTRLLMPRGALAGVAWRFGRFRVGVSLSALSTSSWARPNWSTWSFLPTFGLGIGSAYQPEVAAPAP